MHHTILTTMIFALTAGLASGCRGPSAEDCSGDAAVGGAETDDGSDEATPYLDVVAEIDLSSNDTYGQIVWYDAGKAFAVSFPGAMDGAGRVSLLSATGETLASLTGPATSTGLGATLAVVDDLLVSGATDGTVYAWSMETGDSGQVDDLAVASLTGASAAPAVAQVGDELWIADSGSGSLYAVDLADLRDLDLGTLTPMSRPCGDVSGCGISMVAAPNDSGALLGLTGGYAQHVNAHGQPDWYAAGGFVLAGGVPDAPAGETSVSMDSEGFLVGGYRDGPALPPSGRWIAADGYEADDVEPYLTAATTGILDGVEYRAVSMTDTLWRIGVDPESGDGLLTGDAGDAPCAMPFIANNGWAKIAVICSGETAATIYEIGWKS